jgi:hypothetical protein
MVEGLGGGDGDDGGGGLHRSHSQRVYSRAGSGSAAVRHDGAFEIQAERETPKSDGRAEGIVEEPRGGGLTVGLSPPHSDRAGRNQDLSLDPILA